MKLLFDNGTPAPEWYHLVHYANCKHKTWRKPPVVNRRNAGTRWKSPIQKGSAK